MAKTLPYEYVPFTTVGAPVMTAAVMQILDMFGGLRAASFGGVLAIVTSLGWSWIYALRQKRKKDPNHQTLMKFIENLKALGCDHATIESALLDPLKKVATKELLASGVTRTAKVNPTTGTAPSRKKKGQTSKEEAINSVAPPDEWRTTGRVLVVDGEPMVARLTAMFLEHFGLTASIGHSDAEAIAQLKHSLTDPSEPFRLMIVDYEMSEQVLGQVRAIAPGLPVVVASFLSEAQLQARRVNLALANGLLQKPFRMSNLVDVLKPLLEPAEGSGEPTS